MKYIFSILIVLLFVGCATHTRIAICPGKLSAPCLQSSLPQGAKILKVTPTEEKDIYEVEYR